MTNIPTNIDAERFQAMVNHISSPNYLTFSEEDENSLSHPYNLSLHIKVQFFALEFVDSR